MRISDWSSDVCSSDLCALLEEVHQFLRVGRLGLFHRPRQQLQRDVLDPGMILRRLAVLLLKVRNESLRGRRVEAVMPHSGPGAAEIALAGCPGVGGVEVEADGRPR